MSETVDMTKGKPLPLILHFSLPMLAGNILQQLYNMVDTIVVGRGIGVEALAAVGSTGSLNFLILGFVMGMTQGVSILVSQFLGSKDMRRLHQSITMSILISVIVCVLITVLSLIFKQPVLTMMGIPSQIMDEATRYISIIFACISISYAYNFLSGILRAVGDSKHPVTALIISFVVNVILDVAFVIGFKMGVAGAAYATVIAQGVSALYCLYVYRNISFLQLNREDWSFNLTLFSRSFTLSLPVAIMNSITAVGCMVLQAGVNAFGTDHIAAYSASGKVMMILEQIGISFGYAISTFTGQNMGAGNLTRIRKTVHHTVIMLAGVHVILAAVLLFVMKPLIIMMVGTSSPDIITYSMLFLTVSAIALMILSVLWVYRCCLQALGDTVLPMISGFAEFISRIVCTWLLPGLIGWYGIVFAEVSAWIAACLVLIPSLYYRLSKLSKP